MAERQANPARIYGGLLRSPQAIERMRAYQRARRRATYVVRRMHRDEFVAARAGRSRDAAMSAVAANHPEDFAAAFAAEKHREGIS